MTTDHLLLRGNRLLDMEETCRQCGNVLQWKYNVRTQEEIREVGASYMCGICREWHWPDIDKVLND